MTDFQEAKILFENLSNPNKSRTRGPAGRKPPSRKARPQEDEYIENEANSLIRSVFKHTELIVRREPNVTLTNSCPREHTNKEGKIDSADFDRVWFIRVPTHSCFFTIKQNQGKFHEKVVENNNSHTNMLTSEEYKKYACIPSIPVCVPASIPVTDKEKAESDIVQGKSKKLKHWRSCQIL